jgi:hypothetical protein
MIYNCNTFIRFGVLLCSIAFFACTQDDDISPSGSDIQSVSAFLMNENGLIITLLTDDEDDETYYFDSYTFNFNSDGSVTARDGNNTVDGTYAVFRDDGRVELYMDFPDIRNFDELDDDWYFISIDQNTIRFNDDGDRLEFQNR